MLGLGEHRKWLRVSTSVSKFGMEGGKREQTQWYVFEVAVDADG